MAPLSIRQLANKLGVTTRTIKNHLARGFYSSAFKLPSGQWRIPYEEYLNTINGDSGVTKAAVYCRISSTKDRSIEDQVHKCKDWCHQSGIEVVATYTDIASGLNEKRKGLMKMMKDAEDGPFNAIVILHKDRITRFGFSYISAYFNCHKVKTIIINDDEIKDDYVNDLVSIMTSFCAKIYGRRSSRTKTIKAIDNAHS